MASRGSQEVPRRLPGPPQEMRPLFSPKGSFAEFEPLCSDLSVSTDRAKCGQARPRPKMPRTYPCSLTCSQNGNREPTKLRLWEKCKRTIIKRRCQINDEPTNWESYLLFGNVVNPLSFHYVLIQLLNMPKQWSPKCPPKPKHQSMKIRYADLTSITLRGPLCRFE